MLRDCGKGYVYSVIVSLGVIVSFRFSVFIVKGIFGVHATVTRFSKCELFFYSAPIFYCVTYFSQCDPVFVGRPIFLV